jgi:hypothetical protein
MLHNGGTRHVGMWSSYQRIRVHNDIVLSSLGRGRTEGLPVRLTQRKSGIRIRNMKGDLNQPGEPSPRWRGYLSTPCAADL